MHAYTLTGLVVSAVYGSRINLTCGGSRAGRFKWRPRKLFDISVVHNQNSNGVWSSTISFDATRENDNGSVECRTEVANNTVGKAFTLQVESKHIPNPSTYILIEYIL